MSDSKYHFYKMIHHLLNTNEVVLYGRVDLVNPEHKKPVLDLLARTYYNEAKDYPYEAPSFDEDAASWSSEILFYSAQLVMYREHDVSTLADIIKPYAYEMTDSAILTADLSLRFIPALLGNLQQINIEDELIPLLKDILGKWHYSGLLSELELTDVSFGKAFDNPCLMQMYVDRVIAQKKSKIAQTSLLNPLIQTALGNYRNEFWKEFKMDI